MPSKKRTRNSPSKQDKKDGKNSIMRSKGSGENNKNSKMEGKIEEESIQAKIKKEEDSRPQI